MTTGQGMVVAGLEEPTLGHYGGNVLGSDFTLAPAPQRQDLVGGKISFRDDLRQRGIRRRRDVLYWQKKRAEKRPAQKVKA